MADRKKIGNYRQRKGFESPYTKLSEEDVEEIRRIRDSTGLSFAKLGTLFSVSASTIFNVVNRQNAYKS